MPDRFDFQMLSAGLRRMGWIRFWIQVVLGVVVLGVLLFTAAVSYTHLRAHET